MLADVLCFFFLSVLFIIFYSYAIYVHLKERKIKKEYEKEKSKKIYFFENINKIGTSDRPNYYRNLHKDFERKKQHFISN